MSGTQHILVQHILRYPSYLLVVVCQSVKKGREGEQQQQKQALSEMHFEKAVLFHLGLQHQPSFWLSRYKTRNNLNPKSMQPECTNSVEIDRRTISIPSQNIYGILLICYCWENQIRL